MIENLKTIHKTIRYSIVLLISIVIVLFFNSQYDFVVDISMSKIVIIICLLVIWLYIFIHHVIKSNELNIIKVNNIFNNISAFLIITNGKTLENVNRSFLNFFDFDSMEEFLEHYSCICDRFEKGEGYLQKEITEEQSWLDYLINHQDETHKVKMLDKNKNPKIYLVKYQEYYEDEERKYLVSFDDITQLEKELENNRIKDKQLLQQSRLAQMGEMISMIAHQWRQPLAAISSASSAITFKAKRERLDSALAVELSSNISEYAQHLSTTIDDFRNFFKSNKQKERTCYKEIVSSVFKIIKDSIMKKDIELIQEVEDDGYFESYPNELKQVVLNLIKNAEDVLVDKKIEKPYIKINSFSREKELCLRISDNGGGILIDDISKIFDPYFSTKTKKDGTGLGLYMSKIIIEEHCGGQLYVYNGLEGAVFTIVLKK